jgi:hypothetical protein
MLNSPPENRVLGILRREDDLVVPLSRVRGRMESNHERAPAEGALLSYLERRPDLFLLLAPGRRAPGYDAWPAELRGEYAEVLDTSTLRRETHVALRETLVTEPASGDRLVLQLQRTLLQLWSEHDEQVRRDVGAALELLARLTEATG